MANSFLESLRQTAQDTSPFLTELILRGKDRARKEKMRAEDLESREREKTNQMRLNFLSRNYDNLNPDMQNQALQELGFKTSPMAPGLDYLRETASQQASPNERGIIRDVLGQEQQQQDLMARMQGFGITKQPAVNAIGEGIVPEGAIPGLQRSPESVAREQSLGAQAEQRYQAGERQKTLQDYDKSRIAVQNARKAVLTPKKGGNNADARSATIALQNGLMKEKDALDEARAMMSDTDYMNRSKEIADELQAVRTRLKEMGRVPKVKPNVYADLQRKSGLKKNFTRLNQYHAEVSQAFKNKDINLKQAKELLDQDAYKILLKQALKDGAINKKTFGQEVRKLRDEGLSYEEARKMLLE